MDFRKNGDTSTTIIIIKKQRTGIFQSSDFRAADNISFASSLFYKIHALK
jgi:hypothetical protein